MKISSIDNFVNNVVYKKSFSQRLFWLCLSFTFAAVYSLLAIQQAFEAKYVIADDARQHIFWMQRFINPELFPNDAIADYFQSLAPIGYATFYKSMAMLGISPILVSKLIPAVLCLVTTAYIYGIVLEIIPLPIAGFLASLLANQCIWIHDDFASATSRAFLYPLFCAFIYYLLRNSLVGCLFATILLGLFYPPFVLISAGVAFLHLFEYRQGEEKTDLGRNYQINSNAFVLNILNYIKYLPNQFFNFLNFNFLNRLRITTNRQKYLFYGCILITSVIALLPSVFKLSDYGSMISVAEARNLPEFLPRARTSFFNDDNPSRYWLSASRTGFRLAFNPPFLALALLLPIQLRFSKLSRLTKNINRAYILFYILIVSCTLFFAAHLLLFRLYLPSRYTVHTLRIILAIASSISIVLLFDSIANSSKRNSKNSLLKTMFALFSAVLITFYPQLFWKDDFPATSYVVGEHEQLYEFLQKQPLNAVIASISTETSNLAIFAQRSVLVSPEHAIPYHTDYYSKIRQRLADLIEAQYSPNLADLETTIQKYKVDWWLLDGNAFTTGYIRNHPLLRQYFTNKFPGDELVKITNKASNNLKQATVPAISQEINRCSTYNANNLILLSAKCIYKKK